MYENGSGGVAVKCLARKDLDIIGMIGVGQQARSQSLAISEVFREYKK